MDTGVFLDIVVKDAVISSDIQEITTPLWIVFYVNGLSAPFSTERATGGRHVVWNFAARVVLSNIDVRAAYLYTTLCTYGPGNQGVIALARSRVGLRSLPTGTPREFTFPLMREQNAAQVFANLSLQATLGFLRRQVRSDGGPQTDHLIPHRDVNSAE